MILADFQIKEALAQSKIVILDHDEKCIQPASIDLRVGGYGITSSSGGIVDIAQRGFLELKPGEFAMIMVHERVEFDHQHTARIGLVSNFSRRGLIAALGPQIDPGYKGRLKVGMTNLSANTVAITHKEDFLTIEIHRLEQPVKHGYNGKYQDEDGFTQRDIEAVIQGKNLGLGSVVENLSILTKNVTSLTDRVESLTSKLESLTSRVESLANAQKIIYAMLGVGFTFVSFLIAFAQFFGK